MELKRVTGRPNRKVLRVLLLTLAATLSVASLPGLVGLRINTTKSIPEGFYIIAKDGNAPFVEFCPDGVSSRLSVQRGYRPAGVCPDGAAPLIKPVIARSWDTVLISAGGIRVNGRLLPNTTPKYIDSLGRPLPVWPCGTYAVAPDSIWVASSYHPNSFDSRYFGPISTRSIRHWLRPLWVFRAAPAH